MGMQTVGRMLEKRRQERGLQQVDAAKELKVSRHTYIRWRDGLNTPRDVLVLLRIAQFLGLAVEELVQKIKARDRVKAPR